MSVAAYNAQDYLAKALDSCLIDDADLLDVVVVDDGSTDGTLEIAMRYAHDYPEVFRVVSKLNGGYGSTVNTSIEIAEGRYYRLLDADDWFDENALQALVQTLSVVDVDMSVSPFVKVTGGDVQVVDQAASSASGVCVFEAGLVPRELSMHSVTFRTGLLRECGLCLPECRLYTDNIYIAAPLRFAKTAFVSHDPIYQYRLGREGQSVSWDSEVRNRGDKLALIGDLIDLYRETELGSAARSIIGWWLSGNSGFLLRVLHSLPDAGESYSEVEQLYNVLRSDGSVWKLCRSQSKWFRLLSILDVISFAAARAVVRVVGNQS